MAIQALQHSGYAVAYRRVAVFALFLTIFALIYIGGISGWNDRGGAGVSPSDQNWLQPRPCSSASFSAIEIQCLWVNVSEGEKSPIWISAAILTAPGSEQNKDPLLYLPGGPGTTYNSDGEMLDFWSRWYVDASFDRPLVVLDYRYLAPSKPSFSCPEYKQAGVDLLRLNLTLQQENQLLFDDFNACLDNLSKQLEASGQSRALGEVNSRQNASDTRLLMHRLGYDRWHLLGVSYGARVAITAALTQAEVVSLVLDSPYVFNLGRDSDLPHLWHRAITKFIFRCHQINCSPKLTETAFAKLVSRLNDRPIEIRSRNWETDKQDVWVLNGVRMVAVLYSLLYQRGVDAQLVKLIEHLEREEVQAVAMELEIFYNLLIDGQFQEWQFLAIECQDQATESFEDYELRLPVDPTWRSLFAGANKPSVCHHPRLTLAGLPKMAPIQQPALVVSGQYDPVTPIEEVTEIKAYLLNGALTDLPISHGEFFASSCGKTTIKEFLYHGNAHTAKDSASHCTWE